MTRKYNHLGATGEFYVASYLAGRELLVALPQAGVPGIDMFIGRADGGPPVRIQVKATRHGKINDKQEGPIYAWKTALSISNAAQDESKWFACVLLKQWPIKFDDIPDVFFVPFSVVIERMKLVEIEIAEAPNTWSYFWLKVDEAEQYKGNVGFEKLRAAMGMNPGSPEIPA